MDEIYRMLGREHEADLAREAAKFTRAAAVVRRPWWTRGLPALLAARKPRPATTRFSPPAAVDTCGSHHAELPR
jgi:hypothetical protein